MSVGVAQQLPRSVVRCWCARGGRSEPMAIQLTYLFWQLHIGLPLLSGCRACWAPVVVSWCTKLCSHTVLYPC
mgnify:CR=1 FL=1